MNSTATEPFYDENDELLGLISQEASGWAARTIFGYVIARASSREDAEYILIHQGKAVLQGMWRYFDPEEHDWFSCRIREFYENRVVLIRTNELGFEDSSMYKRIILKHPTDANLQMA